jgi:hypothetical protein
MQQTIEARTVVCDEREKQSVRLTFGSRPIARVMVDDAYLIVHESSNVASPERRPILPDTTRMNKRHQAEDESQL